MDNSRQFGHSWKKPPMALLISNNGAVSDFMLLPDFAFFASFS
jgi:hypothetical protein